MKNRLKEVKHRVGDFQRLLKIHWSYRSLLTFSRRENERKCIYIIFDEIVSHGGLVDRLKGIVSFYEYAKKNGFDFKIVYTSKFKIDDYLETSFKNLFIAKQELVFNPLNTRIVYLMNAFKADLNTVFSESKNYFVYGNVDYLKSLNSDLNERQLAAVWKQNFYELFQFSNSVKLAASISKTSFVAIHTRFTSIMGDFKDVSRKELTTSQQESLCLSLKKNIADILSNTEHEVVVFSDSIKFLNYIKLELNVRVVGGEPIHIESGMTNEDHLKTFVDFYLLTLAKEIYLLKSEEMYQSNFSRYASKLGNQKFSIRYI